MTRDVTPAYHVCTLGWHDWLPDSLLADLGCGEPADHEGCCQVKVVTNVPANCIWPRSDLLHAVGRGCIYVSKPSASFTVCCREAALWTGPCECTLCQQQRSAGAGRRPGANTPAQRVEPAPEQQRGPGRAQHPASPGAERHGRQQLGLHISEQAAGLRAGSAGASKQAG